MKKITLAVLLASGLMAADSGFYVGADIGNTAFDSKTTLSYYLVSNPSASTTKGESADESGGSQTLKVGYYFNQNNRAIAFYQNINVDAGDGKDYGIGYDYLIGDNAFKPFIGVLAGYGSFSGDDSGELGGKSVDVAGAMLGAQIGLNYAVNKNFSVELGYKYMKANMEDTLSGVYSDTAYDAKMEIDTIKNFFFGANYKF